MTQLIIYTYILFSFIPTTSSEEILGVWLNQVENAKIEFYKSDDKYYGKVVWLKDPYTENGKPITDENNPKESLKTIPIFNLVIIKNLIYKNGKWTSGTIYDPQVGKTYACAIWLEGDKLKLRGYIGWFYETKTWTRLK